MDTIRQGHCAFPGTRALSMAKTPPRRRWASRGAGRVAVLAAAALLLAGTAVAAETTQERVHQMGHHVMPFALSKTVHIFRMTETGGVLRVLSRDPKAVDQIRLIRRHLKHEAARFQRGDYSDPARLHGASMPGLKALEAAGRKIRVTYRAVPAGAEITFETTDLRLLTEIHRWFGAQLSEHGADARAE